MLVKGGPEVFPTHLAKADDVGIDSFKTYGRWIRLLIYDTASGAHERHFINQLPGNNTTVSAETATTSLPIGNLNCIFYRDFSLNAISDDSWPNYDNRMASRF